MRQILDESAANTSAAKGSNAQKVGDYYASAMDSMAIEKAGLKYLQPELDRINAMKDLRDLQNGAGAGPADRRPARSSAGYVGQDDKKSDEYAVNLSQGGLSLPDRDYYLKDDARSKAIRTAYTTYLTNTFKMLGDNEATAAKNAATVLRLETRLAKASKRPRGPARPLRQLQQDDGGRGQQAVPEPEPARYAASQWAWARPRR